MLPPGPLVAYSVKRLVVEGTERHDPLVADLAPQGPGLGEAQVMGLAGRPPADQAGLVPHEPQVLFIPDSSRSVDRQRCLVDFTGL